MTKQRVHYLTVKVRLNKPVTKTEARREFNDCIHGEFYPGYYSEAETMKVKAIARKVVAA